MSTLVLCSGGLDSVTLAYQVHAKGDLSYLLSFDYGQKHKKELNFAIKATAADAWRGKPNNFLLQQIIELIPSAYLIGDAKAGAKYNSIRTNFESRISELDGQIKNADNGSAAQANLVKTRANVKYIIDRLSVVEQGFKGITPQDDSITADSFYGVSGITPGTPLEMNESSLDAMSQAYKEFLEE